jgi:hypothetical protein
MDNNLYSEIYNHLEHCIFSSKFTREFQARKNWRYYIWESMLLKLENVHFCSKMSCYYKTGVQYSRKITISMVINYVWTSISFLSIVWIMNHVRRNLMISTLTSIYWWLNIQKCTQCFQYKINKVTPSLHSIVAQTFDERIIFDYYN